MADEKERERLLALYEGDPMIDQQYDAGMGWSYLRAGCDFYITNENDQIVFFTVVHRGFDSEETEHLRLYKKYQDPKLGKSVAGPNVKLDYTLTELMSICRQAIVPESKWRDRDTSGAQGQIGMCWLALRMGGHFEIRHHEKDKPCVTDEDTIWLHVDGESYYLPTPKRLAEKNGEDWY